MSHPSKVKGNGYERELVSRLQEFGFTADRAWGSNGKAIGEHEQVDVRFSAPFGPVRKAQAKRRKTLPSYLKPHEAVDMVFLREDRGETLVVMRLEDMLDMLFEARS